MGTRDLLKKLHAHALYCQNEYQPHKLKHMSMADALKFQSEMSNSLLHFATWLETVHLPQDDIRRKRITESIAKQKEEKNASSAR